MKFDYDGKTWELRDGTFYDDGRAVEPSSQLHGELCRAYVDTMRPDGVVVWEGQLEQYADANNLALWHRVLVKNDGVLVEYRSSVGAWVEEPDEEDERVALRLAVLALAGEAS